jgi:hypothetical protein
MRMLFKSLPLVPLLVCNGFSALAANECFLKAHLVYRQVNKPCKQIPIVVKQGSRMLTAGLTDSKGNCNLAFNIGSGSFVDRSTWLYFYAVRSNGDTVLLKASLPIETPTNTTFRFEKVSADNVCNN